SSSTQSPAPPFPTRRSSDLLAIRVEQRARPLVLLEQPGAGARRVQHELVELGVVGDGVVDGVVDVLGRVLLQADDARPEHAHAIDRKSTRLNSSHVKISYAV